MTSPIKLTVHVQPRATRSAIAGMHGDALKIRLNAPPVDGAANEALIAFIAEKLGVPKRNIRIVVGHTSRRKILEIEGASRQAIAALR